MDKNKLNQIKNRVSKIKGEWKLVPYKNEHSIQSNGQVVISDLKLVDPVTDFLKHSKKDIQELLLYVEQLEKEKSAAYTNGYTMALFDAGMEMMNKEETEELGQKLVEKSNLMLERSKKKTP